MRTVAGGDQRQDRPGLREAGQDLSDLEADPDFTLLALAANGQDLDIGTAAYQVEDISKKSPAADFASSLHTLSGRYGDVRD